MGGWLVGWKAISDYIGVTPRSVRRWMYLGALPVRTLHGKVVALPCELDAWLIHASDIKQKRGTGKKLPAS